jgi:hypothetical protein
LVQSRALAAQQLETDVNRFFLGTSSIRKTNEVNLSRQITSCFARTIISSSLNFHAFTHLSIIFVGTIIGLPDPRGGLRRGHGPRQLYSDDGTFSWRSQTYQS